MDIAKLIESTDHLFDCKSKKIPKCHQSMIPNIQREFLWFVTLSQIRSNYWYAANNVSYDFRGCRANNQPEISQVDEVLNLLLVTEAMTLPTSLMNSCRMIEYRSQLEHQIREIANKNMTNAEIYELGHRLVLENLSPIVDKVNENLQDVDYSIFYNPTKIYHSDLPDNEYMKQFRRLFR